MRFGKQFAIWPLLVIFTTLGAGKAGASETVNLELLAGKHDWQNTPVSFDLPEPLRSWKGYQLIDVAANQPVPVQLDAGSTPKLIWALIDSIKAGGSKRYRLTEKAAAPDEAASVKVQHDERTLRVEVDGKPVLQYNIGVVPSEDPKEPAYARSGFIHPVCDPAGKIVTDSMPADHMHQHGLMFAWVDTTFEGRSIDFWNSYKHEGLIRHVELLATSNGPVCGSFATTLDHVDLKAPGGEKVVLHETWVVHVYKHEGGFLFDLQSTQACAGQSALQINKYTYGGMAVRGAHEWLGAGKCQFLTSEGKDLATGNHTRARWCEMFGTLGDHTSSIAVFSHPANFDAPQPVRLHPEKPYFCWAPMVTGPFSIEPAKSYVSTYRYYIHTGKPEAAVADALYDDFADPPSVQMIAAE